MCAIWHMDCLLKFGGYRTMQTAPIRIPPLPKVTPLP
jgi:hypothetical protein